ncbi:tetratricopeptide repeat protein [Streptomyces sp. YU58]|uniref:tetratricopeptide repeat protein n=1 Tax=Streptomyces sp. SX92 TaxID=3158972 RepID=UPI0027BADAF3|nr:tetratricopeptide repeat protein [Streptomyces coralus]WLW54661.1 tetratricopeptide repeat protein [Streptomyces coralus]
MENQDEAPAPARGPRGVRVLIASVAGCAVLGGVLTLLPWERTAPRAPAPAPGARAHAAVAAGVPMSLPGLAALIGEREARVRARPGDAVSWAVLGSAYVERGRRTADAGYYPRAEKALRTSLKVRAEGNAQALGGLAALANARRDFRAARAWAEAARKLEPRRWTTYPLLIDAFNGLGDHRAARAALDRLRELWSGPAVQAWTAAVHRDQGWREDAAAQLSDAVAGAGTPVERAVYLERAGQLAWERGDRDDALRHFREALRSDPDQRAAQAGQGRALAALGRTTQALHAYRAALAGQPSPQYTLELGELYESLGLVRAARAQYELLRSRVRSAAAGGADEELVLGRFEADHGDPATAVRLLRAQWARQPGIEVADALGWALHRAGDDEEALRFATIATDGTRGGGVRSAPYAYHRGMIERELGRYGPARRHFQEALRINPYFSPVQVRAAREALTELGEPSLEVPDFTGPPCRSARCA